MRASFTPIQFSPTDKKFCKCTALHYYFKIFALVQIGSSLALITLLHVPSRGYSYIQESNIFIFRNSTSHGRAKAASRRYLIFLKQTKQNLQHRMQFIFREIMFVSDVFFLARPGISASASARLGQSDKATERGRRAIGRGRWGERTRDRELNFPHTRKRGSK